MDHPPPVSLHQAQARLFTIVGAHSHLIAVSTTHMSLQEQGGSTPRAETRARTSILLVVEPGLNGVFRHVEGLVDFLLGHDLRVHLAYSSRRSGVAMLQLVDRVRASGGEVLDLRVANIPEFADVGALARLIGLMRRTRPDIVHAHSSKAGALVRISALFLPGLRRIYTAHAYYGMAKPPSLRIRFFNWIEHLLGSVGTTVAISKDEAGFAQRVIGVRPDRISIIHNPVDTRHFTPATAEQRLASRAALGIPRDAVVLATIGRMCWQKDPETAYSGVAPVCAQNPDLVFLHLGWGKWKEYLLGYSRQHGFGPQLRIVDYTDDPREVYRALDGLLISSRYEAGWPLVLLEAMACNIPIVTSNCVGMSDVGSAGLSHLWTFRPEDVAGCTAGIGSWLSSVRGGVRGCNHRDFAANRFSPDRCYGALLELYQDKAPVGSVLPLG
jgi:glycosyltransferase involved in cell wall biosynthesis